MYHTWIIYLLFLINNSFDTIIFIQFLFLFSPLSIYSVFIGDEIDIALEIVQFKKKKKN